MPGVRNGESALEKEFSLCCGRAIEIRAGVSQFKRSGASEPFDASLTTIYHRSGIFTLNKLVWRLLCV